MNNTRIKLEFDILISIYCVSFICKRSYADSPLFVNTHTVYQSNYDLVCQSVPTLKRVSNWGTTFTLSNKAFADGYLYKVYIYGGNPGELGVYHVAGDIVAEIKAHSKVSYSVSSGVSVTFTSASTCIAYYELVKFPLN